MKTLLIALLFTLTISAQENKPETVILLDSTRKIIKFDVKKKDLKKTVDSIKGNLFYYQQKTNKGIKECKYVRRKKYLELVK